MFTDVSPLTLPISSFPLSPPLLFLSTLEVFPFSISLDPNFSRRSIRSHVVFCLTYPSLFPQDTFSYLAALSACPPPLTFPIPKVLFPCFLRLILGRGELRPSFGTIQPSSRPTCLITILSPPVHLFFFFFFALVPSRSWLFLFHHSLLYPSSLYPFPSPNCKLFVF